MIARPQMWENWKIKNPGCRRMVKSERKVKLRVSFFRLFLFSLFLGCWFCCVAAAAAHAFIDDLPALPSSSSSSWTLIIFFFFLVFAAASCPLSLCNKTLAGILFQVECACFTCLLPCSAPAFLACLLPGFYALFCPSFLGFFSHTL